MAASAAGMFWVAVLGGPGLPSWPSPNGRRTGGVRGQARFKRKRRLRAWSAALTAGAAAAAGGDRGCFHTDKRSYQ